MLHNTHNTNTLILARENPKLLGGAEFFQHLTRYLVLVTPEKINGKYSPKSIFDTLKEEEYINDGNGNAVPTEWLRQVFKLLYEVPRSKFIAGLSRPQNIMYSSPVPLALHAFKLYEDIKYSEWDLEEPVYSGTDFNAGSILLGHGLKDYIKYRDIYLNYISTNEVDFDELRVKYLTHSITGEPISETTWGKGSYSSSVLLKQMSQLYRHMLTKTWVFAPQLRIPEMVASFDDIDSLPEIDEIVTNVEPAKFDKLDLPW